MAIEDVFRETVDNLSRRMRSPLLGAFIVAFFIFNWQAIFYLLFADTGVAVRLRFFNLNTSFCTRIALPGALAIVFVAFNPWLSWITLLAIREPIKRYKYEKEREREYLDIRRVEREINTARKRQELNDELEKSRILQEESAISDTVRLSKAENLGGPELKDKLLAIRRANDELREQQGLRIEDTIGKIDGVERAIIIEVANSTEPISDEYLVRASSVREQMDRLASSFSETRITTKVRESLGRLTGWGILVAPNGPLSLTDFGFQVCDRIR